MNYREALKVNPWGQEAYENLWQVLFQPGKVEKALETMEKPLHFKPYSPNIINKLASLKPTLKNTCYRDPEEAARLTL